MIDRKLIDEIEEVKNSDFYQKSIEGFSDKEVSEHGDAVLESTILTNYLINKSIDSALAKSCNKHFCFIDIENLIPELTAIALKKYNIKKSKLSIKKTSPNYCR